MQDYARRNTVSYDRFTPASIRAKGDGPRPSYEAILELVDFSDPAFPAIAAVLRDMKDAGVELDANIVSAAVKLGRQRLEQSRRAHQNSSRPVSLVSASDSIVYYIRRGSLIKIGTTTDPMKRFRDLLPDEICAIEPGGTGQEALRHRQFRHLLCKGEHFSSTLTR